jgi:signal peptidase
MDWRDGVKKGLAVAAIVIVVSLVLGQLFGQPVLLSYVTSDSMEPTIQTGDGFVAVPTAAADSVEGGDVVVYRAEQIQGGGLTTHRIVAETDRGFVTQGDNNPFTDQDSGEPVVKREQIVAVAWQVDGGVVTIPGLGLLVGGIQNVLVTVQRTLSSWLGIPSLVGVQGLAYLIFALTVGLYLLDRRYSTDRRRERSRERNSGLSARLIVGAMAASLVLAATAAMVGPAGPQSFDVVSADFQSERSDVIERGTAESLQYTVGNGGQVPVYVFFEEGSENVTIDPRAVRLGGTDSVNGTLTLRAPSETGSYRFFITEYRYLAVLPQSHIFALYELHPWAPIVVIDAMIGVPFYVAGRLLIGTGRVRRRSRGDGPGILDRIRARLRP